MSYAKDVMEEKWEFMLRSTWLATGRFMMPAFHDPKKFPKDVEDMIRKLQGKPEEQASAEQLLQVMEGLVGDYGEVAPPPKK